MLLKSFLLAVVSVSAVVAYPAFEAQCKCNRHPPATSIDMQRSALEKRIGGSGASYFGVTEDDTIDSDSSLEKRIGGSGATYFGVTEDDTVAEADSSLEKRIGGSGATYFGVTEDDAVADEENQKV